MQVVDRDQRRPRLISSGEHGEQRVGERRASLARRRPGPRGGAERAPGSARGAAAIAARPLALAAGRSELAVQQLRRDARRRCCARARRPRPAAPACPRHARRSRAASWSRVLPIPGGPRSAAPRPRPCQRLVEHDLRSRRGRRSRSSSRAASRLSVRVDLRHSRTRIMTLIPRSRCFAAPSAPSSNPGVLPGAKRPRTGAIVFESWSGPMASPGDARDRTRSGADQRLVSGPWTGRTAQWLDRPHRGDRTCPRAGLGALRRQAPGAGYRTPERLLASG